MWAKHIAFSCSDTGSLPASPYGCRKSYSKGSMTIAVLLLYFDSSKPVRPAL